jgi:hypothetical protein
MQMDAFANDSVMATKAAGLMADAERSLELARNKLQQLQAQLPPGVGFDSKGEVQIIDAAAFKASLQSDSQQQEVGHSSGSSTGAPVSYAGASTAEEEHVIDVTESAHSGSSAGHLNGSTHTNGHSYSNGHANGYSNGSHANGHSHNGHTNGANGHGASVAEHVLLADEVTASRLIAGERRTSATPSSSTTQVLAGQGMHSSIQPHTMFAGRESAQPSVGQLSHATSAAGASSHEGEAVASSNSAPVRRRGRPPQGASRATSIAPAEGEEVVGVQSWSLERAGTTVSSTSVAPPKASSSSLQLGPSSPAPGSAGSKTVGAAAAGGAGDFVPSTRSRVSRGRRAG